MSRHKHESASSRPPDAAETSLVPEDQIPGTESAAAAPEAAAQPQEAASSGASASFEESAAARDEAKLRELEAELARLQAENKDLNEKYLRKLADEVNFRKRMLREKEEAQKYAVSSLLGDLVPILDDFDRGVANAKTAGSIEQLCEGFILIKKQLSQMLENKYALKRFESVDLPFDPHRHEALFAEPAEVEEAIVTEEYLPGYSLNDRIVRTAKVRVKIPAPRKPAESQA